MVALFPQFWPLWASGANQSAESGDYYYEKIRLINLRKWTGDRGVVAVVMEVFP